MAVTPEQFALDLIQGTVTTDRVAAVMTRIAGDRIEVGPLRFGPGGAVTASGVGLVGPITVTRALGGWGGAGKGRLVAFDVTIPGELSIDLIAGSGGRRHRYDGTVVVSLHIAVLLEPRATVMLDVTPLGPGDVAVALHTSGMATFLLQTLGDADREVAAQVASLVNERVGAVADLRRIDLAALLDHAWDDEMNARLGGPGRSGGAGWSGGSGGTGEAGVTGAAVRTGGGTSGSSARPAP